MKETWIDRSDRNVELARRMRAGDAHAREEMIIFNIPLVRNYATSFTRRKNFKSPIDYDSIVGAGFVGLIEAVDTFDPDNGAKFSTYAKYRIYRYFLLEVAECHHMITTPLYLIWNQCGKRINPKFLEMAKKTRKPFQSVEDNPMPENEIVESVELNETKSIIRKYVDKLPELERKIVEMAYFSEDDMGVKAIARSLGINRTKVSRLLKDAYRRIAMNPAVRQLVSSP